MSLWGEYTNDIVFEKLEKDIEVDTLIIGGGIVGVTTLYYLKNNPSVCLVDASRLGRGVTSKMTGKLTYLQGTIYTDLIDNRNEEIAKCYLKSQQEAISFAREIIEKENIACNLEKVISHTFTNKENEVSQIKREKHFLESQKIKVEENTLPFKNKYAIGVSDTYVFHPVKYINGLKEILKDKLIYENTKVIKIEYLNGKYLCKTENGTIICKKVIVSCHYPFFNLPFLLPLKSHIEKSYIVVCKTDKNEKYSCITKSNPSLSIRFYEDNDTVYKIYLASSHNTAFKQDDEENFKKVKEAFHIEEKQVVWEWSNVDIITDDKLPYIGALKQNFFVATGFNTWGISNGILAGKMLSDLVEGKGNKYEKLFSLHRKNFYKVKSFFGNISTSILAMIGSKFKHKRWYSKRLQFSKANGKSIATYTDKENQKHTVYTTCPHFGCSLIFNEKELTWDCPCHSSRFDLDGKCIKGPSLYDISYKLK